jgi:hypothetical protein
MIQQSDYTTLHQEKSSFFVILQKENHSITTLRLRGELKSRSAEYK